MKPLYINKTVYELTKDHPELLDILANLGFSDITKPGMVNTVGRIIKLEQGCRLRKIDFDWLKKELTRLGYTIKEEES